MDPHELAEKILSGQLPTNKEIDSAFDISEILDEVRMADEAMEELQEALASVESDTRLLSDTINVENMLRESKIAMQFENVDASYEL